MTASPQPPAEINIEPLYASPPSQPDTMREALAAAIRCAELALFVIRKQDVMPNSSWEAGFNSDLKKAKSALAAHPAPPDTVREWQPTEAQVNSACLSFRHDFGLLDEVERKVLQFTAREFLRAWQKEGFGSDRNEIIERCALVVDQANREGPYQAIAAASRIRALKLAALPPDAGDRK